ncbi:MAG TPA: hypothetical protein VM388_12995 [Acidimicrobiales bacterium]|nr:hypothetical protein [Acidimicrobiales bacterium]
MTPAVVVLRPGIFELIVVATVLPACAGPPVRRRASGEVDAVASRQHRRPRLPMVQW